MVAFVESNPVDLLIPVNDITCIPFAENMARFKGLTIVACPNKDVMDQAYDKSQTLRTALRLGIPIPKTNFIEKLEDIFPLAKDLQYPVVIKPRWSWYWKNGKAVRGFREFVNSEEEFLRTYQAMDALIPLPLVQEVVKGDGVGVFVLTDEGMPLATFAHHRLREVPVSGGVSTFRESVIPDSQVKEYGLRLLREMKWTGVAMVEFKLDAQTNVPKLMEVNGRFWGSLDLAVEAGVDFPYLLFQLLMEQKPEAPAKYRLGARSKWFRGDLERTVFILKSPNYSTRAKLRSAIDLLNFWERDVSYDTLKLDDPLPGIWELREFANDFIFHRNQSR